MKELNPYKCPMCGSASIKEDARHPSYFHCQKCKCNFNLSKYICSKCIRQKVLLKDSFDNELVYYCPNCVLLSDFYLCPYTRNERCILGLHTRCHGLGVQTDLKGIYRENRDCQTLLLSISNFKFFKENKEITGKSLSKILISVIQKMTWPKNITIKAMFNLVR